MSEEAEKPSKSQRKREMDALKSLAQQLANLSAEHLAQIEDLQIREGVLAAQKITKGNARKRQLQYVAKLLSKTDAEPIQRMIDTMDASSKVYVQKFHRLESWRERLIERDETVLTEIIGEFPHTDRQHRSVFMCKKLHDLYTKKYSNVQLRHRELHARDQA